MFFKKSKPLASFEAPNGKQITDKKKIVIRAGIGNYGGSIKAVSKEMKRTKRNTILHVEQCELMYGFKYKIEGDRYWILQP